ncbi:MAG: hypothetical protein IIT58_06680 [Treponema sp.]|nr:hypothetical protein [Treponema sp.]
MNKYTKSAVIFALTGLFFVSCASTPKVPFSAESVSPAAIISITANDEISWYGDTNENKSGLINMAIKKAAKDKANDASLAYLGFTKNLLDDAAAAANEVLENNGFTLVKDFGPSYESACDDKVYRLGGFVAPKGYKMLGLNNSVASLVKEETDANYFVYISYQIQKTIVNGVAKNGSMTACVTTTIQIADAAGKRIKLVNGYASGTERIGTVAGVYDAKALYAMYPKVIRASLDNACKKLK